MIRLYLKDQLMWIIFVVSIVFWMNILINLDIAFSNISVLYMNSMVFIFLICFLIINYIRLFLRLKKQNFSNYKAASFIALFELEQERLRLEMNKQKNEQSVKFQEHTDEQIRWIHEMKTPLTAQRLMIDSIQNSELKHQLELEWFRMHLLLDQTLHTLRFQSLNQDLVMQKVSLQSIVISEVKAFQSLIMGKGLAVEIDELHHEVHSDSKWLQFIFRQLLSNAIKYSSKGSTIVVASGKAKNERLFLAVSDEGAGIAAQDIPRVFQRGFTGNYGRQQNSSTGMGLYLAKSIAQKLKVEIQIESVKGKGTTVKLFFPQPNKVDLIGDR